ncbi:hypothetical protein IMCC3317_23740 [Kordia antarctica]|uniref:Uncharacterized protein n=1 Tax=Kordia antarctica TaxID=1218801 RepID=A0A7L4ZJW5_9FLAO|nr:hypothetical protein [Kordia antarctica]QHI37003.1 hypothetical protein IMCC3317_23740 [Kordia antarctica]
MKNKEIIFGAIVGLLTTVLGTFLYLSYVAYQGNASIGAVWDSIVQREQISTVIVYGAALNFVAFFGFLKFNKEASAKGVLIITIFTAVFVFAHKLLA